MGSCAPFTVACIFCVFGVLVCQIGLGKDASLMSVNYQQAINNILAYIREQRLERDDRLPSEREFGRQLDAGRPALNKAVACLISQGVLRREGYKLLYQGEVAAKAGPPAIHVIHPHSQNFYRFGPLEAAHDVAEEYGSYTIPVLPRDAAEEHEALTRLLRTGTKGFVIWPQIQNTIGDLLAQFRQLGIPFVVCDQDLGGFDFVGVDNEEGTRLAVEHLRELGHRDIVYITRSLAIPSLVRRRDGYRHACLAAKLKRADRQVIEIPDYSVEQCALAFAEMRRKYPAAKAIMGSNDLLVLRVLDAAKAAGLRVPEDLSAVGFDDIDAAAQSVPALTTVRQNFYEIGVLAAQLLFRRLNKKGHALQEEAIRIKLEPSLIQRASTARAVR